MAGRKKIVVVGAGPAGMRCALTAAKRGHTVTLYEKRSYPGGMMYPGSRPKSKTDGQPSALRKLQHCLPSCPDGVAWYRPR